MENQNNDILFDEGKTIASKGGEVVVAGLIGKTLGEFEITREIGRGGMGVVYEAIQKSLNRKVAIKVLPESFSIKKEFVDKFLKEAKVLASLSHPNIIPIYHFGEEKGVFFFAMEYVDGIPLTEILLQNRMNHREMPLVEILSVVKQAASGLQFAHNKGAVHMDMKPGNILIDSAGRARVADFGLVRLVTLGENKSGEISGTPMYMSPEQMEGRVIDHRSDIYSLGCVFYELLTGSTPFREGTLKSLIAKVVQQDPVQPSKIARDTPFLLDDIVLKLLKKSPDDRYQSLDELITIIDRFQKGLLTVTIDEQRSNGRKKRIGSNVLKGLLVTVLIGAGALAAAIAGWDYYNRDWTRSKMNLADNYLKNGMRKPALSIYNEVVKKAPFTPAALKAMKRIAEIERRK
jgi:serine/threonine protein kinase